MDEIADFRSSFITHNNFHYNCKLSFSVLISTLIRENLEALFSIPIFENYLIYQENINEMTPNLEREFITIKTLLQTSETFLFLQRQQSIDKVETQTLTGTGNFKCE